MSKLLYKLLDIVDKAAQYLVGFFLACMSAIIIVEVFRRYIWGLSFAWSDEVIRYMMISSCFLGAPSAYRLNQLAKLDLLADRLSPEKVVILDLFINSVILIFSAYLAMNTFGYAMKPSILNQSSVALHLPVVIPYMTIPIGFFFMVLYASEKIIYGVRDMKNIKGKGGEELT